MYDYLVRWNDDNTLIAIHHALYLQCREMMQREPSPTACVVDSQSVKGTEKGGRNIDPSDYDAGKKIKGKKRHILVDTVGLVLHAIVHPADIGARWRHSADRDAVRPVPVPAQAVRRWRYQGPQFEQAIASVFPQLDVEIVKRSDAAGGFKLLPRRWARLPKVRRARARGIAEEGVERTFAWLNRCRRLCTDFENLTRNALAFLRLASIRLMLRKVCNP